MLFSTSDTGSQGGSIVAGPGVRFAYRVRPAADTVYELSLTGPNVSSSPAAVLPGVLADMLRLRTNSKGVLRLEKTNLGNLRLRIARV